MHVLILTPGFPENESDTDCIPPMQEYLKELRSTYPEINISVIALHYPFRRSRYEWNGINVYACGGKGRKKPLRIIVWITGILAALKINRKTGIDIVHSFWLNETAMLGSIICKLIKVKHVSTLMGQDAKETNKYFKILKIKKIFTVAVSYFQAGVFKQSCKSEPDKIIPWGIKTFPVENSTRNIDLAGAGSLIPLKNFELFLNIIKGLKKEFPLIRSVIMGDGEQKKYLEKKISEYGLGENVNLAGHIKRESVLSVMMKSKILLHTSHYEAFGYVIAEALASGCIVVCRPVGCARDCDGVTTVDEDNNFINTVKNILLKENNYKPRNLFPVEDTVKSYVSVYLNLLKLTVY